MASLLAADRLGTASAHRNADDLFSLDPGKNPQPHEGPTEYKLYLKPEGEIKAVMLFVDFPDAPQQEMTRDLYESLNLHSVRWYKEASYKKISLDIVPVHKWYRMPKESKTYEIARGMTFEKHREYISDAVSLAAADIKFGKSDIVYIVASKGAALPTSPAFNSYPGTGVKVKDHEILHAATFGVDIRVPRPHYGAHVLIHETGHIFGLPDLYEWKAAASLNHAIRAVGGWDIMSFNTAGAQFLAWHKWKLGWLDAKQVQVVRSGRVETTLTPLETVGGLKAIVVPTGPATAYVVEARQPLGKDNQSYGHLGSGVLIYTVDATVANGSVPIQLKPANTGEDKRLIDRCGPLYNAAYNRGPGEKSSFKDSTVGLTVDVLGRSKSDYKVRVGLDGR